MGAGTRRDPFADDPEAAVLIDIDLDQTAHANVRKLFDQRRSAANKYERTLAASLPVCTLHCGRL
jgi:hypothetical protein